MAAAAVAAAVRFRVVQEVVPVVVAEHMAEMVEMVAL